jgi:transposase
MIEIEFSAETIKTLDYERYNYPDPRVQRKLQVVWLKSQKLPNRQIGHLAGVTPNTVTKYLREYQQGGIEQLKIIGVPQPKSLLEAHKETLETYFAANPPATIKAAMAKIEELTGFKRSETQVRRFLERCGLKRRKVGMIPAKADVEKQETFKQEQLLPRLDEAKAGTRKVFFVDAAHFVLAAFLGFLWCLQRLFVKAPSGRQRFNVLGALDAITHRLIMVTNDTYINATTVCELLRQLADRYGSLPITLVLDNARYQHCVMVQQLAAELNIELLFLPPYSPNLNLIERLWKFTKKKCLYSKYYSEFGAFKNAIFECLTHTHDWYKDELDSFLTLNFQTFEKSQTLTL